MQELVVYFDYGSPYAYLAWQRITHVYPERYEGAKVVWEPASAGHLFKRDGSRSNVTMANQKRHLLADVTRYAKLWDVPFAPPADGTPGQMPVYSVDALRLHFVAAAEGEEAMRRWMHTVYLGYFRDSRDISDRKVLSAMLREAGIDATAEHAERQEWKKRLVDNTAAAYDAGAPGVPYIVFDGEGYWGNDRLNWVEARLAGEGPRGA